MYYAPPGQAYAPANSGVATGRGGPPALARQQAPAAANSGVASGHGGPPALVRQPTSALLADTTHNSVRLEVRCVEIRTCACV